MVWWGCFQTISESYGELYLASELQLKPCCVCNSYGQSIAGSKSCSQRWSSAAMNPPASWHGVVTARIFETCLLCPILQLNNWQMFCPSAYTLAGDFMDEDESIVPSVTVRTISDKALASSSRKHPCQIAKTADSIACKLLSTSATIYSNMHRFEVSTSKREMQILKTRRCCSVGRILPRHSKQV